MKNRIDWSIGLGIIILLVSLLMAGIGNKDRQIIPAKASEENLPVKIIEKVVYQEPETIDEYIKFVFGEDYDKAMLLLKGKGPGTCAENPKLKWDAQNYNSDGSVDIGVFQINTYWQQVQAKWLYNWKVNVQIAHQLFEENENSFKLWTCGKVYGI